jgi:hypothetical protein
MYNTNYSYQLLNKRELNYANRGAPMLFLSIWTFPYENIRAETL